MDSPARRSLANVFDGLGGGLVTEVHPIVAEAPLTSRYNAEVKRDAHMSRSDVRRIVFNNEEHRLHTHMESGPFEVCNIDRLVRTPYTVAYNAFPTNVEPPL